ncbi:MAG: LacI family transcriptional regulator, partial [Staphylococcus epidermidis]|nr:LacI family transcriptional regulator [Staphylococcus epidermidis]
VSYNYFEAGEQALKEINQLLKGEQTTLKIKIPIKLN